MTRLTNDMRDNIRIRIMAGLPNVDYLAQISVLIQSTIIEFAPKQVQELYSNDGSKHYLKRSNVELRGDFGSRRRYLNFGNVYGLKQDISFNVDPRVGETLQDGSLIHALYTRLLNSEMIKKYNDQITLRDSVVERIKANLAAATTIKKLYTVLEPELHGYIPKEADPVNNLPTTVAPVADDLRKLGANLPEMDVK